MYFIIWDEGNKSSHCQERFNVSTFLSLSQVQPFTHGFFELKNFVARKQSSSSRSNIMLPDWYFAPISHRAVRNFCRINPVVG